MASSACLSALLLAASVAAIAGPRSGLRPAPWSARARARLLLAASVMLIGASAVALALSLVGVNEGAVERSPAIEIGALASLAVAAILIRRSRDWSRASGPRPR